MEEFMKLKICLILCICSISAAVNAQIGIGTTSPNSIFDIRSVNQSAPAATDGILIPKVDAFPATNPTASQYGMMVFLTTASGANVPGFYFWNNPGWVSVGSTTNWTLTGNTASNPATNYIGTSDDKDIVFKRFGIRAGYIGNPNTLSGNKNTTFGANSYNTTSGGTRNSIFGTNILSFNTSGSLNVAIGDQAMYSNTSGTENTAIGTGALYSSAAGVCNVAIGRNALTTTNGLSGIEGSNNTAVGYVSLRANTRGAFNNALGRESLYRNLIGNNNVGIGYQSGYNSLGSGNVFLGNLSGYNETGSNKLYIENTNADESNSLIYGEFDNNILRTNAQLQIGNPATTGYSLPVPRGTNGQVLQTNGSGNTSWVTPNNNLSIVRTKLSANQLLGTSGWQKILFDTPVFDDNVEFNAADNSFVAAKAGYYQINSGFQTNDQTGNATLCAIAVRKNGILYQEFSAKHYGNDIISRNINCIVKLAANDRIEIYVDNTTSGVNLNSDETKTYFEVHQIK